MHRTVLLSDIITEYSVRNKNNMEYPVYSVTNSQGFCRDYFGKEVASKDKSTYKVVPYGCFAYNPSRINVGSIDWQHCEDNVIVSPLYNVFSVDTSRVRQDYLMYYFRSRTVTQYISALAKGTVRMNLSLKTLGSFPIMLPDIEEQRHIVSELDLLSNIIQKEKQQISELGSLTDALFFELFGDPINNEKGWRVESLGAVCDVRDGTHDSPKYLLESEYVLITSKNIVNDTIDFTDVDYISKEDYDAINKRSKVVEGDIIMAMIGTIGKPIIVPHTTRNFCIKNVALIKFKDNSTVTNVYIRTLLNSSRYSDYLKSLNKGGTQKFVSLGTIRSLPIPVPPMSLMNELSDRLSIIDKQRNIIQNSISELVSLQDCRMDDYYRVS